MEHGTELTISDMGACLDDWILKYLWTVRSLMNLLRSLNSVKLLGCIVGAKVSPFLRRDRSYAVNEVCDRL